MLPIEEKNNFFQQVYDIVCLIPHGRVTSYGAIASALGVKGSARMVGWALNASHIQKLSIPAHRVVNRNGLLTGKHHFDSPDAMQCKLQEEGITIKHNAVVDFNKHFWDPLAEINTL